MIRKIAVENVKCSGCANSINKRITAIKGVNKVIVNADAGVVTVDYEHQESIWEEVKSTLLGMGYAEQGIGNFIDKAKSYVSCAVGKMSA